MAALGQVNFPTHQSGHSLDLVFTKAHSEMKIIRCNPGNYLSDHYTIECLLSLKKCNMQKKEIKYRKLKSINPTAFSQHLKLDGFEKLSLDEMVEVLNKNLQDAIDALVPIKSRMILARTTNPCFNNEVRDQKRRMRNQEKKWRKYKLESNWKAFKSERSKYRQMLREARRVKIAEKVNECDNNVKKLYNLVNHLMGGNLGFSFPDSISDEMLANQFADFFMEKIKRIRDNLETHPIYNP